MRYLGLDLGTKTLGISITDKTNTLVSPLTVLRFNNEDYESVIIPLKELITKYDIKKVILGLPKNMDGSLGFASKRSLKFQKLLEQENIDVELIDERLTTKSAINIMHQNQKNYKQVKDKIDSIASCIILESYLRKCENETKE